MTATNHVLTGIVIGSVIHQPLLALPIAFLSHFVLDALPHYSDERITLVDRTFLYILFSDMCIAAGFLAILVIAMPINWPVLLVCGVLASSPDLMWLSPWLQELKGIKPKPFGLIRQFHSKIQWCTKPWGIGVEAAWAVGSVTLLVKLI